MTEQQLREKTVNIMRGWIGCKQGDKVHRSIIDTYNSIRPLPVGYRLSYTEAWCAAAVSAAGKLAGVQEILFPQMNCGMMIARFKQHGRWVEDDAHIPSPGDLVIYYWGDSGVGDCKAHASHVGMVETCDGSQFTVIEGNMGSGHVCGRRTMQVNGRYIRGFCCPDYASMATPEEKEEEEMTRYHTFDEIPDWAKPEIKELMDAGALRGDEKGDLSLSDDLMRAIIINKRYTESRGCCKGK